MHNFTIELMNYRCFSGDSPIRWNFTGDGLTSFVGPNNAGKSTFVRLVYELRTLFSLLSDDAQLSTFCRSENGFSFLGTEDPAEIPSFGSQGPTIIDLTMTTAANPSPYDLTRVRMTHNRSTGGWKARLWARGGAEGPLEVQVAAEFPPMVPAHPGVPQQRMNTGEFRAWLQELVSRVMYIPAYRNLINQGGGNYYDIGVGTQFIQTWDAWKGGGNVANRRVILGVIADIRSIFGFTDLAVDADAGTTTLQIGVDGRTERIRELGAGLSQFIIVLGNVAIKRPEMLFIDEPELNLHPAFQLKFLNALAKYSKHIVFASHSIGLARAADRAYSVTREATGSVINPLSGVKSYAELLGELSFSAYRELGFERVLCVEGLSDVRAMQTFLRMLKLDQETVVIPLGGSQFITADRGPEIGELLRITENLAILIDSEKTHAEQPLSPERQAFVDTCRGLGANVHVTARRAFEHYFSDAAVKAAKGEAFRALTPYEDFGAFDHAWAKSENWLIAERMTAPELVATDIGTWLIEIGGVAPT